MALAAEAAGTVVEVLMEHLDHQIVPEVVVLVIQVV